MGLLAKSHPGFLAFLLGALAPVAYGQVDHTTYVVRLDASDVATLQAVEAAGGVIDHFDGHHARAYVHTAHWEAFQQTGIGFTVESIQPPATKQQSTYPSHAEVGALLTSFAEGYPELCTLSSIGTSVQGRELWALKITDNPDVEEDEPEFAYIATLHGDETVGTVLCLNFIAYLLQNYGHNAPLTTLVNSTEIWVIPLANPDGYELGMRFNANNVDLNRSFPEFPNQFEGTIATEGIPDTSARQPEVAAIMAWTFSHSPVLTANYHGGALVVNYPYDLIPGIPSGTDAPTPDDALMISLAAEYASLNPPMLASTAFPGGITNGSAWYSVSGGLQDWHYRFTGAIDFTLEVSNIKSPSENTLTGFWDDNRAAMLAYLERSHRGVRGLVTDGTTGAPLFATVTIDENPQPVFTDPEVGDYHRLLLPGTYRVRADAEGYIPYTVSGVAVGAGSAARVDVTLSQGDVDGNGRVDALDLQLVINTILGRASVPGADVDGNGVSATDLQHLVNRVLRRS